MWLKKHKFGDKFLITYREKALNLNGWDNDFMGFVCFFEFFPITLHVCSANNFRVANMWYLKYGVCHQQTAL